MTYTLEARTYVNADRSKVVPEESSHAAFLLGGPGDEIPDEQAKALGLVKSSSKGDDEPHPKAAKPKG